MIVNSPHFGPLNGELYKQNRQEFFFSSLSASKYFENVKLKCIGYFINARLSLLNISGLKLYQGRVSKLPSNKKQTSIKILLS